MKPAGGQRLQGGGGQRLGRQWRRPHWLGGLMALVGKGQRDCPTAGLGPALPSCQGGCSGEQILLPLEEGRTEKDEAGETGWGWGDSPHGEKEALELPRPSCSWIGLRVPRWGAREGLQSPPPSRLLWQAGNPQLVSARRLLSPFALTCPPKLIQVN